MTLTQCAPAKINLALHVRQRLDNGYHLLDTIFAFAADGDVLHAEAAQGCSIVITGPFAEGLSADAENLVMKAAQKLAEAAGVPANVRFTLDKNLPIASGIGGGSADAAAALRLCNILWGLNWPNDALEKLGLNIGADVPACLRSISCHGTGIGEELTPIAAPDWQGLPLLLVNPLTPLSTAQIFNNWDGEDRGPLLGALDTLKGAIGNRNDLEPMAMALCPSIIAMLQTLRSGNPLLARMSGSGATCFAIYADIDQRDRAAEQIKHYFPDVWLLTSRLHDWHFSHG